ncbi:MAG: cellulase family glycosylhydrolase [Bacteroidales bacterium]|jgi:endoglucanase|nr:cellulase family glycosylhydrolase [Bacteroidales bacterium]
MFGMPGTDAEIRAVFEKQYGTELSQQFWNSFYSAAVNEADIAFVQQCGLNNIRIPVNYKLFNDAADFTSSTAIREIDRILALCKKYSLWAIIDLHTAPKGQNPDWHSDNNSGKDGFWYDTDAIDSFIAVWIQIAEYYSNNTTVGGYDLINEPCYFTEEGTQGMMSFYQKCTSAIRKVDQNHIIFYEGNTYSRDFSMFTENLDDNCAYTFHLYPFLQLPDKLHSTNKKELLRQSLYKDVSLEHLQKHLKKPLWCGETGHPLHLPDSFDMHAIYLDLLEELNIGWAVWPLKDVGAMGMLNVKQNSSWTRLCNALSENWVFWDIFNQDSILSVENEQNADPYSFYKRIAKLTTEANKTVEKNSAKLDFETLKAAIQDFSFDACEPNTALLESMK